MKTLKLIIMPDGRAKELNPWGERPVRNQRVHGELMYQHKLSNWLMYQHKLSNWKEAEANRKSYEVDWLDIIKQCLYGVNPKGKKWLDKLLSSGTIVEAELIDENTVRVVKILES